MTQAEFYLKNKKYIEILWIVQFVVKSVHQEDGEHIMFFKDHSVYHDAYLAQTYKSCEEWLDSIERTNRAIEENERHRQKQRPLRRADDRDRCPF